jgi:hypothetical protein
VPFPFHWYFPNHFSTFLLFPHMCPILHFVSSACTCRWNAIWRPTIWPLYRLTSGTWWVCGLCSWATTGWPRCPTSSGFARKLPTCR